MLSPVKLMTLACTCTILQLILIKKIQIDFRLILYNPQLLGDMDDKSEPRVATSKLLTIGIIPLTITGLTTCNTHSSFRKIISSIYYLVIGQNFPFSLP